MAPTHASMSSRRRDSFGVEAVSRLQRANTAVAPREPANRKSTLRRGSVYVARVSARSADLSSATCWARAPRCEIGREHTKVGEAAAHRPGRSGRRRDCRRGERRRAHRGRGAHRSTSRRCCGGCAGPARAVDRGGDRRDPGGRAGGPGPGRELGHLGGDPDEGLALEVPADDPHRGRLGSGQQPDCGGGVGNVERLVEDPVEAPLQAVGPAGLRRGRGLPSPIRPGPEHRGRPRTVRRPVTSGELRHAPSSHAESDDPLFLVT